MTGKTITLYTTNVQFLLLVFNKRANKFAAGRNNVLQNRAIILQVPLEPHSTNSYMANSSSLLVDSPFYIKPLVIVSKDL